MSSVVSLSLASALQDRQSQNGRNMPEMPKMPAMPAIPLSPPMGLIYPTRQGALHSRPKESRHAPADVALTAFRHRPKPERSGGGRDGHRLTTTGLKKHHFTLASALRYSYCWPCPWPLAPGISSRRDTAKVFLQQQLGPQCPHVFCRGGSDRTDESDHGYEVTSPPFPLILHRRRSA